MGLYFHNATGSTIDLAYAEYDPSCASECTDKWLKRGWYIISAGDTVKVWSGLAGGKTFFYYAESATARWSGPYFTAVPPNAFEWCWCIASSDSDRVGFRKLSPTDPWVIDRTINLS